MDQSTEAQVLKRLETPLRITWAGLWAERITRAFWPLWSVAIASLAAASFRLQDLLPLEAAWFLMVAVVIGLIWGVIHGFMVFRKPSRLEALVRLDSRLPGQPIAALRDTQAIGINDEASKAVWAAHRARMAQRAAAAKPVEPDLQLASRDPFALRYVALTAFVMALLFGSVWEVKNGLKPAGSAQAAAGPTWEGWAQPPAYTGKPTLYLNDQTAEALTLPTGTKLQLRLYGEPGALIVSETVSGRTDVPPASAVAQDFIVTTSGKLSIEGTGGRDWKIIATPDTAPSVQPEAAIGRDANGRFKQKFSAKDDYGVTKGQVSIALDLAAVERKFGLTVDPEAMEPVVLDLPLTVKGKSSSRSDIKSVLVDDLSESLLSNMPVTITYAVTDAAGQSGTAEPLHVVLPGKRFFDPLADALIEMRRDLMWSRVNAAKTTELLKAIDNRPEGFVPDKAQPLLAAVIKRLDAESGNLSPKTRDIVVKALWEIALEVEDGKLNDAKERMMRAEDRLAEAIRKGASPEEIQKLMDELRDAVDDYMAEEAKKHPKDPNDETSPQQKGPTITQDQIDQMMQKIQKLMEEGKTGEAAELMKQLQEMLNNMKVQQGDGQGKGKGSPGKQAMKDLGDKLRQQQKLSDDSFKDLQDGQENPGEGGKTLSERQKDLREKLKELKDGGKLPGKDGQKGQAGKQALDEAGRAMKEAEDALKDGDLPGALDKQGEALDQMRQGLREFGDALAEEDTKKGGSPDPQKNAIDDPNGTGPRDPLGRDNAMRLGSDGNLADSKDVYRRAQELLDEIRKRAGDQQRSEGERGYLQRLLDMF